MRYAVVWPEGRPDNAVFARGVVHCEWLRFWLGIKTWWSKPTDARRICVLTSPIIQEDYTASAIASYIEAP